MTHEFTFWMSRTYTVRDEEDFDKAYYKALKQAGEDFGDVAPYLNIRHDEYDEED